MSHLLWLIGVGTAAVLVLRPASPAPAALRRFAIAALAALIADGVAWPLGVEWLRPLTALFGGGFFIAAALAARSPTAADPMRAGGAPDDGPRSPDPKPSDAAARRLALALEGWTQPAALATGDGALEW
ncbi:MAG: hypothetical protein AAFX50_21115, partial [Acidobacteriota bacterium]